MSRKDRQFLSDIVESIERIRPYRSVVRSPELLRYDAIQFRLMNIVEASRQISREIRDRYSEVPWSGIIQSRNRMAHEYFRTETDFIDRVLDDHLGPLEVAIRQILEHLD